GTRKRFIASHPNPVSFTTFVDSIGVSRTLGSTDTLDGGASLILYNVNVSAAWPPGIYADTILVSVDSVFNSPLVAIQYLNITDTSGTDTTGTDTTGNDTTGGGILAEELYISQSTGVGLGETAVVALATQAYRTDLGGFELLVTYNGQALTLTSVTEGSVITTQGWEYFTSTVYNAGSVDATVRVIGIADLNNGANHPNGSTFAPGASLALLNFQTPTDSSYFGAFLPIRWIWQDCGDNTLSNLTGDTAFISRSVFDYYGSSGNPWTNYRTPLTDTLASLPSLGGAPLLCGAGARGVDYLNGGIWFVGGDTLIDTTGTDTTGTDTTVVDSSVQLVRISQTGAAPGQHVAVNLVSDSYSPGMGGFDFLVSYDDNVLTLLGVDAGSVITNNGWEYFTTRSDNDGNGLGYVRVVSVADLNDGANHPTGFAVNAGDTFAHLNFQVSSDTTLSGVFSPVSWLWLDCGDNGIANQAGDTLYISREVYDYKGSSSDPAHGHRAVLTAPGAILPSFGGAPTNCVGGAVRHTDFFNGGVQI
ncbi:MAG TPA: cohesin domain-containing protein, partial [candidate division Zixibacteria bacterium]|nr:cohesin domain-containing protein [candidate division Zixibacteria bacterium]